MSANSWETGDLCGPVSLEVLNHPLTHKKKLSLYHSPPPLLVPPSSFHLSLPLVETTHRVIKANWKGAVGGPRFENEILVAHGPTKRSYHIVVKMYDDATGKEVLLRNFNTCKIIANIVTDALGTSVLVDRKPGHGGKANPDAASFIDLAIYTKDRPFRLVFSSKITSPNRPFVDGAAKNNRVDKTVVMETLVVPPDTRKLQAIDITNPKLSQILVSAPNRTHPELDDTKRGDNLAHQTSRVTAPQFPKSRVVSNNACSAALEGGGNPMAEPRGLSIGANLSKNARPLLGDHGSTGTNINATNSAQDERPLLDYGKGCVAKKALGQSIPLPFKTLIPWVSRLAGDLPDAKRDGLAIRAAHYEHSEDEAYVHFTIRREYAAFCHCVGRPHAEQNVMITIDLLAGVAYQRCWDRNCKDATTKGSARHVLSCHSPPGALPSRDALSEFNSTP